MAQPDVKRLTLKEREELELSVSCAPKSRSGTQGRVVTIRTNFVEVSTIPSGNIAHYDVTISPTVPPRLNREIFNQLEKEHGAKEFNSIKLAFDGRANAYASRDLPKNAFTLDVTLTASEDKTRQRPPRIFTVKMKKVASISTSLLRSFLAGQLSYTPYEALQALEVVIKHIPSTDDLININRSFYSPKNTHRLSGCVDAWLGYFQALKPAPGRLLLNIDTSATCFYHSGSVLELLASTVGGSDGKYRGGGPPQPPRLPSSLSESERIRFEHAVKGLKVQTNHNPKVRRKYRVIGVSRESADRIRFEDQNGNLQSVAEYFAQQYKIRLRYPSLPCIRSGTAQKQLFLPLEVCDVVPGQRYMKKLNEDQTAEMIKLTCQKPHLRLEKCSNGFRELSFNDATNPIIKDFGFKIGSDFCQVDSRVLPVPKIFYSKTSHNPEITPEDGAWNMRDKRMYIGAKLRSWAVLVLAPRISRADIENFVRGLTITAQDMGLEILDSRPPIFTGPPEPARIEKLLRQAYLEGASASGHQGPANLVLVVLPSKSTLLYGEVKRATDCVIGRPSQCIIAKNVMSANKTFYANVVLKLNAKLGGINATLGKQLPFVSDVPTIIFGADVTHPGVGDVSGRSIVSVVASLDIALSRYVSKARVQEGRQEVISDLQAIVKNHLVTFYKANRQTKPQRIIFYRDGVGEGQFSHILNVEVTAIRKACLELESKYQPKITYIILQKRHHVRFFPVGRGATDRSGNCLPGTVVDTTITHPIYRDFYLLSHAGIQGTSRPIHYHVLVDENEMSPDDLQALTYRLCYTYARCSRSVSVTPPAYYAHLVAFRSRLHFKSDENTRLSTAGSDPLQGMFTGVAPELECTMYFC